MARDVAGDVVDLVLQQLGRRARNMPSSDERARVLASISEVLRVAPVEDIGRILAGFSAVVAAALDKVTTSSRLALCKSCFPFSVTAARRTFSVVSDRDLLLVLDLFLGTALRAYAAHFPLFAPLLPSLVDASCRVLDLGWSRGLAEVVGPLTAVCRQDPCAFLVLYIGFPWRRPVLPRQLVPETLPLLPVATSVAEAFLEPLLVEPPQSTGDHRALCTLIAALPTETSPPSLQPSLVTPVHRPVVLSAEIGELHQLLRSLTAGCQWFQVSPQALAETITEALTVPDHLTDLCSVLEVLPLLVEHGVMHASAVVSILVLCCGHADLLHPLLKALRSPFLAIEHVPDALMGAFDSLARARLVLTRTSAGAPVDPSQLASALTTPNVTSDDTHIPPLPYLLPALTALTAPAYTVALATGVRVFADGFPDLTLAQQVTLLGPLLARPQVDEVRKAVTHPLGRLSSLGRLRLVHDYAFLNALVPTASVDRSFFSKVLGALRMSLSALLYCGMKVLVPELVSELVLAHPAAARFPDLDPRMSRLRQCALLNAEATPDEDTDELSRLLSSQREAITALLYARDALAQGRNALQTYGLTASKPKDILMAVCSLPPLDTVRALARIVRTQPPDEGVLDVEQSHATLFETLSRLPERAAQLVRRLLKDGRRLFGAVSAIAHNTRSRRFGHYVYPPRCHRALAALLFFTPAPAPSHLAANTLVLWRALLEVVFFVEETQSTVVWHVSGCVNSYVQALCVLTRCVKPLPLSTVAHLSADILLLLRCPETRQFPLALVRELAERPDVAASPVFTTLFRPEVLTSVGVLPSQVFGSFDTQTAGDGPLDPETVNQLLATAVALRASRVLFGILFALSVVPFSISTRSPPDCLGVIAAVRSHGCPRHLSYALGLFLGNAGALDPTLLPGPTSEPAVQTTSDVQILVHIVANLLLPQLRNAGDPDGSIAFALQGLASVKKSLTRYLKEDEAFLLGLYAGTKYEFDGELATSLDSTLLSPNLWLGNLASYILHCADSKGGNRYRFAFTCRTVLQLPAVALYLLPMLVGKSVTLRKIVSTEVARVLAESNQPEMQQAAFALVDALNLHSELGFPRLIATSVASHDFERALFYHAAAVSDEGDVAEVIADVGVFTIDSVEYNLENLFRDLAPRLDFGEVMRQHSESLFRWPLPPPSVATAVERLLVADSGERMYPHWCSLHRCAVEERRNEWEGKIRVVRQATAIVEGLCTDRIDVVRSLRKQGRVAEALSVVSALDEELPAVAEERARLHLLCGQNERALMLIDRMWDARDHVTVDEPYLRFLLFAAKSLQVHRLRQPEAVGNIFDFCSDASQFAEQSVRERIHYAYARHLDYLFCAFSDGSRGMFHPFEYSERDRVHNPLIQVNQTHASGPLPQSIFGLPSAEKASFRRYATLAARQYAAAASVGSSRAEHYLSRMLVLFCAVVEESELREQRSDFLATLMALVRELPAVVWFTVLPQMLSRVAADNKVELRKFLLAVVRSLCSALPRRTGWYIASTFLDATATERNSSSWGRNMFVNTLRESSVGPSFMPTVHFCADKIDAILAINFKDKTRHRENMRAMNSLLQGIDLSQAEVLLPFRRVLLSPALNISILRIDHRFEVFHSKARPLRIKLLCDDGNGYDLLCKGNDDLKKDMKVSQIFSTVNQVLSEDAATGGRGITLKTYQVFTMGQLRGIVEMLDDVQTLRNAIFLQKQRDGFAGNENDVVMVGFRRLNDAKQPQDKIAAFKLLLKSQKPVLHRHFLHHFDSPSTWLNARSRFTRTWAAWSVTGYFLGIGDRHLENIMLTGSGDVAHVDFDCLFEKGLGLTVPEFVPFRLTVNAVRAMGIQGTAGQFERTMEMVLRVFRSERERLLASLDAFIHDPLLEFVRKRVDTAEVLRRAFSKLQGIGSLSGTSEAVIVKQLISDATSPQNLATIYPGWCPWV